MTGDTKERLENCSNEICDLKEKVTDLGEKIKQAAPDELAFERESEIEINNLLINNISKGESEQKPNPTSRNNKKASFDEKILNFMLNLWNKIVSYFCSSTSSKGVPAQNHESVSEESIEKAEKVEPALKEKLGSRGKGIDNLSERTGKLEETSIEFRKQTERVKVQVQGPGGRWNFL